ncbi:MAG: helix-turn-helix domain-containing protein, partial [Clostridiales bacterium]|nr:helix-turn-helix domain-containing protein [Clostridiales bacterium]MDR2091671.1 helix-turn-helix domain-containing protein [Clostridiales bacterium]
WEQGKTEPNIANIQKLCKLFGVTADYILGLEGEGGEKLY